MAPEKKKNVLSSLVFRRFSTPRKDGTHLEFDSYLCFFSTAGKGGDNLWKTGPEEAQYFHVRPPIGFI